jgi:CheY-like chemotaxis protein
VVIVDLVMAEIDGLELCRYVSNHPTLENTTLIVVSGLDEAYWRDRTKEVGAAGFLAKPITSSMVKDIEALAGVPRLR